MCKSTPPVLKKRRCQLQKGTAKKAKKTFQQTMKQWTKETKQNISTTNQ
jgi:hypothetical protein